MKKALVVGGSNGIGLAVVNELLQKGYLVFICDRSEPDFQNIIDMSRVQYKKCNLLDLNLNDFAVLADDAEFSVLFISAGIGRCAHFENLNFGEIKNTMTINAVSAIEIIRYFYKRISSAESFYCGAMVSIAGFINSPLFSVYAASKAALCRFLESVNVELEKKGTRNRILNVSPGSIKGTKFNGGKTNDLNESKNLAEKITENLLSKKTLFIPEYDTVFKSVLERNFADNRKFGLESYDYKMKSGRVRDDVKGCIGYLSGTFDLFHVGHLNLLKRAKEQCDYLIVGVHPNAAHKGKETFISFDERKSIVASVKYVDEVIRSFPEDSEAWETVRYNKLFVGSDYKGTERFNRYEKFFADKGVQIVYFSYTKGTSSTQIREAILSKTQIKRDLEKLN